MRFLHHTITNVGAQMADENDIHTTNVSNWHLRWLRGRGNQEAETEIRLKHNINSNLLLQYLERQMSTTQTAMGEIR